MVAAGVARTPAILVLAPAGQRGDVHVRHLRHLAQPSRDGVAVDAGQPDVEEDHVGGELHRGRERRAAIVRPAGLVTQTGNRQFQHRRGVEVVLDDQHAKGTTTGRPGPFRGRRRRGLDGDDREANLHLGALPRAGAPDLDLAVLHLHEASRQGQSDAQAADRAFEDGLGLVEHLEDARESVGRDADAGIADADDGEIGVRFGGEPDVPGPWRELHGVLQDVGEDLHEPCAVAADDQGAGGRLDVQGMPRGRRERRDRLGGDRHQARDVQGLAVQLDLVGRDPRHVQQVVDQTHQLPDLTLHDVSRTGGHRRRRIGLQRLEREPDGCEGVAQFVRQRGEELVLALVGLGQPGGAVAHPEFELPIERVGFVLRGPEACDELTVGEPEPKRGRNHHMEAPGRHHRRHGEESGEERHHDVGAIALDGQPQRREEARWQQEGEKRLGPGRQQGRAAEHHAADGEHQQDLVRGLTRRVQDERAGAPSQRRQGRARHEQLVPAPDLLAR